MFTGYHNELIPSALARPANWIERSECERFNKYTPTEADIGKVVVHIITSFGKHWQCPTMSKKTNFFYQLFDIVFIERDCIALHERTGQVPWWLPLITLNFFLAYIQLLPFSHFKWILEEMIYHFHYLHLWRHYTFIKIFLQLLVVLFCY